MKAKEIKITPPEGYEVDQENSTFDCIKFKKKEEVSKWRDDDLKMLDGYYMDSESKIHHYTWGYNTYANKCVFATLKQVKSALAMAQISQIMANDKRFGGVITDKEWDDKNLPKYCIGRARSSRAMAIKDWEHYHFLAFHTMEQMRLFMSENKDLIKDYFMLD